MLLLRCWKNSGGFRPSSSDGAVSHFCGTAARKRGLTPTQRWLAANVGL
jgi:hypothetical protein